jgi:FlaA1/EpsC-like NDP-sugar epimerase
LATLIVPLARLVARAACRRSAAFQQNAVIIGAGDVGQLIAQKVIEHPEYGIRIVGFIDDRPRVRRADLPERLAILGAVDRLTEIIEGLDIERVVVSFSSEPEWAYLDRIHQLRRFDVQVDVVPRLFELMSPRVAVHGVEGLPLIGLPPLRRKHFSRMIKRAADIGGARILLALKRRSTA